MLASGTAERVQDLSDLELALLVCLLTEEHCIIQVDGDPASDLDQELRSIAKNTFGLSCATVECSETTSLDDFSNGIIDHRIRGLDVDDRLGSYSLPSFQRVSARGSVAQSSRSGSPFKITDERKVANVVIARNLDLAPHAVQIQALELIRNKRIYTRTAVHATPKHFVLVAVIEAQSSGPVLTPHLNDQFFISHYHDVNDGYPDPEDQSASSVADGAASAFSMSRTIPCDEPDSNARTPIIPVEDVVAIQSQMSEVRMSAEVRRYLHNIITFLRLHRAVAGGISAAATRHFTALVKALASLHSLSYVPPSLVALAARKTYPHRVILVTPEKERSMQWGSEKDAVTLLLEGLTVEDVLEDVLQSVDVPL